MWVAHCLKQSSSSPKSKVLKKEDFNCMPREHAKFSKVLFFSPYSLHTREHAKSFSPVMTKLTMLTYKYLIP